MSVIWGSLLATSFCISVYLYRGKDMNEKGKISNLPVSKVRCSDKYITISHVSHIAFV